MRSLDCLDCKRIALIWAPAGIAIFALQLLVDLICRAWHLPYLSFELPLHAALSVIWFVFMVRWASRTLTELDLERQNTSDFLEQWKARFRDLMQVLPIGIFLGDSQGAMFDVNPAGEAMLGCTRDDIIQGRVNWTDGLSPEEIEAMAESWAEVIRTGSCTPFERDLVRPDGSRVPVLMGVKVLSPHVNAWYAIDVTERKGREVAVARAHELEDLNSRIIEQSSLKSRVLAQTSHELRTPLNAIGGFAEVLLEGRAGPISAQQEKFLGHIVSSAHHLRRLIEDVLDISRAEAGKIGLVFQETRLDAVVEDVCRTLGFAAAEAVIQIEVALDPGLDAIVTDVARLKQILFNYVSNAIKFTPERGRVRVEARPHDDACFRIDVKDTGIGIAEADLARLFREFERVNKGPRCHKEGAGLGLAVTRHLARALGGRVECRSVPGSGSTFSVVLPVRADLELQAATSRYPVEEAACFG